MIAFGILGPLEARRDGAEVALGGRTHRAILALLLLEAGRVVSIDRIADELYAGLSAALAERKGSRTTEDELVVDEATGSPATYGDDAVDYGFIWIDPTA